jgi:hypothetical protein
MSREFKKQYKSCSGTRPEPTNVFPELLRCDGDSPGGRRAIGPASKTGLYCPSLAIRWVSRDTLRLADFL